MHVPRIRVLKERDFGSWNRWRVYYGERMVTVQEGWSDAMRWAIALADMDQPADTTTHIYREDCHVH
jgi:hypothetical protein